MGKKVDSCFEQENDGPVSSDVFRLSPLPETEVKPRALDGTAQIIARHDHGSDLASFGELAQKRSKG